MSSRISFTIPSTSFADKVGCFVDRFSISSDLVIVNSPLNLYLNLLLRLTGNALVHNKLPLNPC